MSGHISDEILPSKRVQRQTPSQWRRGEGKGRVLLFLCANRRVKLEVLKIWKESDEIQNLSAGADGCCESEKSKPRCEVPEVPVKIWHKCGHLKIIYPELLEVRESGEIT